MLFEELGRALYRGPYFATIGLTLPALPAEDRAAVASGETSWTLAFGPLVPDLDSAEHVAIVGGDGIYELEGGERELLAATDESRPLGVVRGGEPGGGSRTRPCWPRSKPARRRHSRSRRAGSRGSRSRTRSSTRPRASSSARRSACTRPCRTRSPMRTRASSSPARSRSGRRGASRPATTQASIAAAAAKSYAGESAVAVCETAIQSLGGIGFTWEHRLHRLYKRALGIESFGASGTRLRAEIAASLIEHREGVEREPGARDRHPRRLTRWTA